MIRFDILTQKRYESDLNLKLKENDIQLTQKSICGAIRVPVITESNLSSFWVDLVKFSFV